MSTLIKSPSLRRSQGAKTPKISPEEQKPGIQELRLSSCHWLSRMDSSITEIQFLKKKVERYLISHKLDCCIDRLQSINKQLCWLTMHEEELKNRITKHQKYLKVLLEKSRIRSGQVDSLAHSELENDVTDFITALRHVKRDLAFLREQGERS